MARQFAGKSVILGRKNHSDRLRRRQPLQSHQQRRAQWQERNDDEHLKIDACIFQVRATEQPPSALPPPPCTSLSADSRLLLCPPIPAIEAQRKERHRLVCASGLHLVDVDVRAATIAAHQETRNTFLLGRGQKFGDAPLLRLCLFQQSIVTGALCKLVVGCIGHGANFHGRARVQNAVHPGVVGVGSGVLGRGDDVQRARLAVLESRSPHESIKGSRPACLQHGN